MADYEHNYPEASKQLNNAGRARTANNPLDAIVDTDKDRKSANARSLMSSLYTGRREIEQGL